MSEFRFTYPRFVAATGQWLVNAQLWRGDLLLAEARHWRETGHSAWCCWSEFRRGQARSLIQPK